jgi:glucokinase
MLLALDFGGTKHSAAVLEPGERQWREHRRVFSPPGADAAYDLETMLAAGRALLRGRRATAVGASFGGPVDFTTGTVRLSHHVPGWENTPLRRLLEDAFHAPAAVDNDANVAALGEHRYGAGRGADSFLYLTISTGVGGGWIINGRVWRGYDGMAGEIGHTVIDPQGPLCLCGKRGCVERLASGPYLAADAQAELRAGPQRDSLLRRLAGRNLSAISGQMVAEAARQGDPLAQELVQRSAWAVAVAIGNAANLVNPQRFILGGGVTKAGEAWWETIRQVGRQTALPEVHFEVAPAALADDAPLWGAVALAQGLLGGDSSPGSSTGLPASSSGNSSGGSGGSSSGKERKAGSGSGG